MKPQQEQYVQEQEELIRRKCEDLGIPAHMHQGIVHYVVHGIGAGDFLSAVFSNELVKAAEKADLHNQRHLHTYARLLFSLPRGCWGTRTRYKQWCESHGLKGLSGPAPCAF